MYKKVMIPVDLAHVEKLDKAISTGTDLAKTYGIPVCFAGVTTGAPSEVAHTPAEYKRKLEEFGTRQSQLHGIPIETAVYTSHDPAADLDNVLIAAADENDVDLIVMASHVPGLPEHIFSSNAGAVASHAGASVFVVR